MNVAEALLAPNLSRHPDRVAYLCDGEALTFRQLDERSSRFAGAIAGAGAKAGDRAVLVLPDGFPYLYALFGAFKAGVWPALVSTTLGKEDYEFVLADSEASLLVADPSLPAAQASSGFVKTRLLLDPRGVASALSSGSEAFATRPAGDGETALLLYTSGTTGRPKGVLHSHRDMPATADTYGASVLGLSQGDVTFSASKLFFAYGLGNSVSFPLRAGATAVLHPGKPSPDDVFRLVSTHRATVFFGVPTLYNVLLGAFDDFSPLATLRLCVSAGEAMPPRIFAEWRRQTGLEPLDGIGTTEALHIFVSNFPGAARPGTTGVPVPGYEVRLVDEEGREVPDGEDGQLLVRGPSVTSGYWRRPEKDAEAILPGGWLRTGDVYAREGEGGALVPRGRFDDMFKVGAQWISPTQIEAVLSSHPAVRECAITGTKTGGLVNVAAHVVLTPGFEGNLETIVTLRRHVLDRLPPHMAPARVDFCTELPKTATGKVQRFRLRPDPHGS